MALCDCHLSKDVVQLRVELDGIMEGNGRVKTARLVTRSPAGEMVKAIAPTCHRPDLACSPSSQAGVS